MAETKYLQVIINIDQYILSLLLIRLIFRFLKPNIDDKNINRLFFSNSKEFICLLVIKIYFQEMQKHIKI